MRPADGCRRCRFEPRRGTPWLPGRTSRAPVPKMSSRRGWCRFERRRGCAAWLPRRTSRAPVPTMPSRRQPRQCTSKKKPQRLTGGRCDRGGRASPHLLRGAASPHAARPRRRSQTNPNAAGRLARSAATRCEQKGEEEWLGFSRWDGRRAGFVARAYHGCRRIGDRWPMAEQADVDAGEPE